MTAERTSSYTRKQLLMGAKLLVGIALLAWVLASVDWETIGRQLGRLEAWVLGVILLATAFEFVTRFATWHVLLRTTDQRSWGTVAHVDLSIKFVNHVVPSKAAGHAVAPLMLRHFADLEWGDAVGIAGANTAIYSALYGLTALVGLAIFALSLPVWLSLGIAASTGLYLLAAAAIGLTGLGVGKRFGARLATFATTVPLVGPYLDRVVGSVPGIAGPAREAFRAAVTSPTVLSQYTLAWCGTLAVFPAIRVGLLLAALGEPFEPWFLLPIALVTAYSVTVMPITPGGVGVAEFSALYVFVALGVPEAAVVPAILVDRFLGVYLPALIGWLPMMNVDLGGLLEATTGADEEL